MTECQEVALALLPSYTGKTFDDALRHVRANMPDETLQIIDNVAQYLHKESTVTTTFIRKSSPLTTRFKDVMTGQCFKFSERYYIRSDEENKVTQLCNGNGNTQGWIFRFLPDELVQPVDIEIKEV